VSSLAGILAEGPTVRTPPAPWVVAAGASAAYPAPAGSPVAAPMAAGQSGAYGAGVAPAIPPTVVGRYSPAPGAPLQVYGSAPVTGAVPSGPTAGMAPSGPTAVPQPRRRGKAWLVVLIVVLVLAAIGVAAFVALGGLTPEVKPLPPVTKPIIQPPPPPPPPPPPQVRARVTITTTPAGAQAAIDGIVLGPTPAVANVAPGRHTLVVEAPGYRRRAQPLEIVDDKPLPVTVTLEREPASKPPPAKVDRKPPRKPPTKRPSGPTKDDDGHKSSPYG